MLRIRHGEALPLEDEEGTGQKRGRLTEGVDASYAAGVKHWPFGYLFPDLQRDPTNLLPTSERTVAKLKRLGSKESMEDPVMSSVPGVPVPTAYTFLGQFIDHDITFEEAPACIKDLSALTPLTPDQVNQLIVNLRSPNLDLDSVYWPGVRRDCNHLDKLLLGRVSKPAGLPHGKDECNDLPRGPKCDDPRLDRVALIGDPRNDENLIVAQLHVAFLRAHNALIDRGYKFAEARRLLRQHYQWIVLNDFLERVADPAIVKKVRNEGPQFFNPPAGSFFMPLEFSAAAYRFGHSKVRNEYFDYNERFNHATLLMLFVFTKFSGDLGGDPQIDQLPGKWVIDWTHFLDSNSERHFARPIDTTLATMLFYLQAGGITMPGEPRLAVRNLLRGYVLSLPTGQAVARAMQMKSQGIRPLTEGQIRSVAANSEQLKVLEDNDSEFLKRTPLWFYILAEAAYYSRGYHLGPVGSTIVAEVLIGILRQSDDSILANPYWRPTLGLTPGKFDLPDLLKLAGVL